MTNLRQGRAYNEPSGGERVTTKDRSSQMILLKKERSDCKYNNTTVAGYVIKKKYGKTFQIKNKPLFP